MTTTSTPSAPAPAGALDGRAVAAAPVLPSGVDEVPLLREALTAAWEVDRAVARLVEALLELDEHQLAEAITGVALEQWLAAVGRRTRSDRRMLLATCEVLRRLPSLRQAFCDDATVSWAQVRTTVLQVQRVPRRLDDAVDAALARAVTDCGTDDPDVLSSVVGQALRSLDRSPASQPQRLSPAGEFLAIQPRLDGSGGTLFGELGALGLATVDAALTPPPEQTRDGLGHRGAAARGRARRLVALCDASLTGSDGPPMDAGAGHDPPNGSGVGTPGDVTDGVAGGDAGPAGSRPQLLVRVDLATLLDQDALPAQLLTRLMGGKLWVDAATVRRLVDQRGADLRTVVLDDTGQVVGVGRRTRVPPDWLADTLLALHDTCTAPGCARPARGADTDHARPWTPTTPGAPGGRTDADQLGPLCRTHNRTKETVGWQVTQTTDGTRRWHHPATGLTTTTRPATWQPPNPTPEPRGHCDPEPPNLAREPRGPWDPGPPDPGDHPIDPRRGRSKRVRHEAPGRGPPRIHHRDPPSRRPAPGRLAPPAPLDPGRSARSRTSRCRRDRRDGPIATTFDLHHVQLAIPGVASRTHVRPTARTSA